STRYSTSSRPSSTSFRTILTASSFRSSRAFSIVGGSVRTNACGTKCGGWWLLVNWSS
ncbi:unnamed protein product, partial [Closterium sp. NIES-54]